MSIGYLLSSWLLAHHSYRRPQPIGKLPRPSCAPTGRGTTAEPAGPQEDARRTPRRHRHPSPPFGGVRVPTAIALQVVVRRCTRSRAGPPTRPMSCGTAAPSNRAPQRSIPRVSPASTTGPMTVPPARSSPATRPADVSIELRRAPSLFELIRQEQERHVAGDICRTSR
jgi:hypothetical protein